ncbi:MAG: endo-1,4-beta-xylanase, partial [Actinomycetes bacterium]
MRVTSAACLVAVSMAAAPSVSSAASRVTRPSCANTPQTCTLLGAANRSGIWAGVAMDAYPPDPTKATVAAHFNSITIENAMKWDSIQSPRGTFNFGPADDEVDWANRNRIRVRAHTLLFHRTAQRPWARAVIESAPDPQAKARQLIGDLIRNVVGHFRGRVATWDVINEP